MRWALKPDDNGIPSPLIYIFNSIRLLTGMFLRTVKVRGTKGQTHEYLRLVESYWANGRSKQRVVTNLGRKDLLAPHLDSLVRLLHDGARDRSVSPALLALQKDASLSLVFPHEKKNDILGRLPVFSDLNKEHLFELSKLAVERYLNRGQFLFREGEPAECLYVVVSGMVKILKHSPSGKDFIVAFCASGEMLGDVILFSDKPHPSAAQAIIDSKVLVIKNDDFLAFLRVHSDLTFKVFRRILNTTAAWLFENAVRLTGLAAETAEHRLAYTLYTLSLKFGLTIPFTRQEIAEMAGTSTETAMRFISRLKQIGVVGPGRGKVIVLEQAKLQQSARRLNGYL